MTSIILPTSKIGILTAAWQNGGQDPKDFCRAPLVTSLAAFLKWIEIARDPRNQLSCLQVAAALDPNNSYIENKLDPVGYHLPVITLKDGSGQDLTKDDAEVIRDACAGEIIIDSAGAFENCLHQDENGIGRQIHKHIQRVARGCRLFADLGLGTEAVAGFIGFDERLTLGENLDSVARRMRETWQVCKDLGLKYRIENCPMPGWWKGGKGGFYKNIACQPEMLIKILQIADAMGFSDVVDLGYDFSHCILMRSRAELTIHALVAAGYGSRIGGTHGKDQNLIEALLAVFGGHGQLTDFDGEYGEWVRMICEHSMIGMCHYNPNSLLHNLAGDFIAQQILIRQAVSDITKVRTILEHEWNSNRVQDETRIREMIAISSNWVYGADLQAAAHHATLGFCETHNIQVPGKQYDLLVPPENLDKVLRGDGSPNSFGVMNSPSQLKRLEAARSVC